MKRCLLVCLMSLASNLLLEAWQPSDWVYTTWPYAYEASSGDWYFLLETGNQWIYSYPPGNAGWHRLEASSLTEGWAWYMWPLAHGPVSNHWHMFLQTDQQWAANLTTEKWSQLGFPVVQDELLTKEVPVSVTQNGNLNNQGLVTYDETRDRHVYSVGTSIRAYDPATGTTETLLTLQNHGHPTFLNIRNDALYFIESGKHWLIRYHMTNDTLEVLQEGEFKYAGLDSSGLHVNFWQDGYINNWTLRRLKPDSNTYGSSNVYGVDLLNLGGSRYWYTIPEEATLMLRDSYSGSGRTSVFYFESRGFSAVHEMVIDSRTTGLHKPLIAFILEKDGQRGVYLLQVTDPDAGELHFVMGSTQDALQSLAFDGTYFYFIRGSSEAAIYRVHMESREVEKFMDVSSSARNLNFANYWLYFGESDSDALYRVNPATREVEAL